MTVVRGRWFPASILFPHRPKPWRRCYVVAADDGLHVFQTPSETADWHAPIDWALTSVPATEIEAKAGFDVHTTKGLVVVTRSSGGCRCGAMGRWAGPLWARVEQVTA